MSITTTPKKITKEMKDFVNELGLDEKNINKIKVHPIDEAAVGDCMNNVMRKVRKDGGEAIGGYCIWEWYGVMYDFEVHMIWKSNNGDLVDITPKADGETEILFIENSEFVFTKELQDNKRYSLSANPDIKRFIELSELRVEAGNDQNIHKYNELTRECQELSIKIKNRKLRKNDWCHCGSYKKHKNCCMKKK